jgi:Calcineurin-like phosphoesterase
MKTTSRIHTARAAVLAVLAAAPIAGAQELKLPNKDGSVKFAVLGDWGTGAKEQYQVGEQMAAFHTKFPYPIVITVGDNIYGTDRPEDFRVKFELPYKDILGKGVKFYATLGNHDNPTQRFYQPFNMGGERFYTFRGSAGGLGKLTQGGVRFFMLDSNYMDKAETDWLTKELSSSGSEWKIAVFHHPLYSSGARHGSSLDLRAILEPIFLKGGVNVVLTGHDHDYERVKPQKGIYHFVVGSGGSLRKGDLGGGRGSELTEKGFDSDFAFMLVEIDGDDLNFQAIDRLGKTVDAGVIKRPTPAAPAQPAAPPSASPVPVPPASPAMNPPPTPAPSPTPPTPKTGPALSPDAAVEKAKREVPSSLASPSPTPSPSPRS